MIKSQILADSVNTNGDRLTTFKVTFPRYILAELNTHRAFSRNSASSRAIPFKKMVKMVQENPFIPIAWQKDHKGMQGTEYLTDTSEIDYVKRQWLGQRNMAIDSAHRINSNNVTKQLCNRLLEPFMWHTVIVTSSQEGLENFFKLRCPQYNKEEHNNISFGEFRSKKDVLDFYEGSGLEDMWPKSTIEWLKVNKGQADIHIMALAEAMWDDYNESKPKELQPGEWHVPFGDRLSDEDMVKLCDLNNKYPSEKEVEGYRTKDRFNKILDSYRRKIAVSRCARISYQTLGDDPKVDYEADLKLFDRLSKSGHWSPFEHVAQAMDKSYGNYGNTFGIGAIEGMDYMYEGGWCRNFKGFVQMRELVDK